MTHEERERLWKEEDERIVKINTVVMLRRRIINKVAAISDIKKLQKILRAAEDA